MITNKKTRKSRYERQYLRCERIETQPEVRPESRAGIVSKDEKGITQSDLPSEHGDSTSPAANASVGFWSDLMTAYALFRQDGRIYFGNFVFGGRIFGQLSVDCTGLREGWYMALLFR